MARSRVELFEQIRRDWRAGGSSIRELAVRHHVHRRRGQERAVHLPLHHAEDASRRQRVALRAAGDAGGTGIAGAMSRTTRRKQAAKSLREKQSSPSPRSDGERVGVRGGPRFHVGILSRPSP